MIASVAQASSDSIGLIGCAKSGALRMQEARWCVTQSEVRGNHIVDKLQPLRLNPAYISARDFALLEALPIQPRTAQWLRWRVVGKGLASEHDAQAHPNRSRQRWMRVNVRDALRRFSLQPFHNVVDSELTLASSIKGRGPKWRTRTLPNTGCLDSRLTPPEMTRSRAPGMRLPTGSSSANLARENATSTSAVSHVRGRQ